MLICSIFLLFYLEIKTESVPVISIPVISRGKVIHTLRNDTKPYEHLFRLSPRQTLFRSRYERFRWKFSNFAAKQALTMEQKFGKNSIDIEALREFCEREGKEVTYRKGDQLERGGDPARWFGFVTEGCFKYVTYGISDDREHITWFSFEGEFAGDYPAYLDGGPALTSIEAMVPSHILRVSGEQLMDFFRQDAEKMELRSVIAEHLLSQARACYLDLHRATARERYELLLQRCPGIVEHLALQDLASFLCITPQMLSRIRKEISFGSQK